MYTYIIYYYYYLLKSASHRLFQWLNDIKRFRCEGFVLNAFPQGMVGSSLNCAGALPMLKFIATHKVPFVALDMPYVLHQSLVSFSLYLDRFHWLLLNEAARQNQLRDPTATSTIPSSEIFSSPHIAMVRNYRSDYFALGINESDPGQSRKVLALMGSAHVSEVVQRLTNQWNLSNPIKHISGNCVTLQWNGLGPLSSVRDRQDLLLI
ncbi:hypothetical protein RFI_28911 [Reticulomyxa filosa]|uniref:Uncharacterized protein n=1 Tax=Reticulomyxa filosa TaxID=46433 RepID=X6M4C7_RETFI|nr:hypothetical protein RFI_28911 [Reticulomyxa filosa]|eukprot:ETO08476.1 hypothetical protein RFI_28911 [Reticulomyxa filosa]